jgi:hypothetical protein
MYMLNPFNVRRSRSRSSASAADASSSAAVRETGEDTVAAAGFVLPTKSASGAVSSAAMGRSEPLEAFAPALQKFG